MDNLAAIELLERAVTVDPALAAAQARLAVAYVDRYFYFAPEDQERWEEKAHAAVERALSLDPDVADAYLARGRLLWTPSNRFPHDKAIRELRRAIALNPNSDDARGELALILNHIGLNDEGLREAQAADAINPSAKRPLFQIGYALLWQGKYEQALPVLLGIPKEFNPGSAGSFIAWALFQLGRGEEAKAKLDELSKILGFTGKPRWCRIGNRFVREDRALDQIRSATKKQGFGHFSSHGSFHCFGLCTNEQPRTSCALASAGRRYWTPLLSLVRTGFQPGPSPPGPTFHRFDAEVEKSMGTIQGQFGERGLTIEEGRL